MFHTCDGHVLRIEEIPRGRIDIYTPRINLVPVDNILTKDGTKLQTVRISDEKDETVSDATRNLRPRRVGVNYNFFNDGNAESDNTSAEEGEDFLFTEANNALSKSKQKKSLQKPINFSTDTELSAHRKTEEHQQNLIKITKTGKHPSCGFRNLTFSLKKTINVHESTHHIKNKPFVCRICGNRFTQCGQISIHMRIHTGARPFPCSKCGKRFNQKTHLRRHLRIHSGLREFSCNQCSAKFHQKSGLARHLNAHKKGTLMPYQVKRFKEKLKVNLN